MTTTRDGSAGDAVSIVWFRQDLRLADNPALAAAARAGRVLPVFILDDAAAGQWAMGGAHRWWLHGSLQALAAGLKQRGATLILRRGRAAEIIPDLVARSGATTVHAGQLMEPWARRQDADVAAALPAGVTWQSHRAGTLFDPGAVRTKTGGTYGIYTPFARAARALGDPPRPLPAPDKLAGVAMESDALESWGLLPAKPDWAAGLRDTWHPGEAGAHERMASFMAHGIAGYEAGRNTPGEDLTSMLSPHMHWGELSPAQSWHAALATPAGEGRDRYLAELLWHEFSAHNLYYNPHVPDTSQRAVFDQLPWRDDPVGLRAWQTGHTGIPIVDAGMRQLWHVGWMHNRVRMITASFLIKHLLVDWRVGERWFWDTLVDGDLAVNAQSWQWVAGSGVDSQPFYRVFNPVTQGEKFDAAGTYVRRWVPELANLASKHIHAPWDAPADMLAKAGVVLGQTYPRPIVGLAEGRDRALAAFRTLRQAA